MAEQTTGPGLQATKPPTYTDEYRRQVVDMVTSTGRTAMSVVAELGIHHTLISRWMRRYRQTGQVPAPTPQAAPASPLKPVPVPHADQAAEPDAEHLSGSRGSGARWSGCGWSGTSSKRGSPSLRTRYDEAQGH